MATYAVIGFFFVWAMVIFVIAFLVYMSLDYKHYWKKVRKPVRVDYGALPFEVRATVSTGGLICVYAIDLTKKEVLIKSYFGLGQIKPALRYKKRIIADFNKGASWIGNALQDKEEGK